MISMLLSLLLVCTHIYIAHSIGEHFHDRIRLASQMLLDTTNAYRCIHGVLPLVWDDDLALSAQAYADYQAYNNSCTMEHSHKSFYADRFWGWGARGENLAWGSERFLMDDAAKVVSAWYNEPFTYAMTDADLADAKSTVPMQGYEQRQINHFTAMIWSKMARMGCGLVTCYNDDNTHDRGELWVCHYLGLNDEVPNNKNINALKSNVLPPVNNRKQCGIAWEEINSFDSFCASQYDGSTSRPYIGAVKSETSCSNIICEKEDGTSGEPIMNKIPDDIKCKGKDNKNGICHKGYCDITRSFSNKYDICNPNPCQNDGICNIEATLDSPQYSAVIPMNPQLCTCKPGFTGALCEVVTSPWKEPIPEGCDIYVDNTCYKSFAELGQVSFDTAQDTCRAWGGTLPSVKHIWLPELLYSWTFNDIADPTWKGGDNKPHWSIWTNLQRIGEHWRWSDDGVMLAEPTDEKKTLDVYPWTCLTANLRKGRSKDHAVLSAKKSWVGYKMDYRFDAIETKGSIICSRVDGPHIPEEFPIGGPLVGLETVPYDHPCMTGQNVCNDNEECIPNIKKGCHAYRCKDNISLELRLGSRGSC